MNLLLTGLAGILALPWLAEFMLFRRNTFILFWAVLIPLSIPLTLGSARIAPSEILLLCWLGISVWKIHGGKNVDFIKHPISILLILEIIIYAFSTLNSTIPAVSYKRFVLHTIYILSAYFCFSGFFSHSVNIRKTFYAMGWGLIPVLISTFIFLSSYGFNSEVAPEGPRPFFSDHTEFGAFAAIVLPFVLIGRNQNSSNYSAIIQKILSVVVITSTLFSYSRAVWLSVAAMICFYVLIRIGMRFRHLILLLCVASIGLMQYGNTLYQSILENKAQSSQQEVLEQLKSVGNVKTDVSNLERINRWKSAVKMFREKPSLGFGPGTYQFQYAPFQELNDKTVISTNFGDAGNAHSEFLMYLSETGIVGFTIFILLCLTLLHRGFSIYRKSPPGNIKNLSLALLLSLSGILTHSLFNSFLETDKIGIPFYLMAAAIVALDIQLKKDNSALSPASVQLTIKM